MNRRSFFRRTVAGIVGLVATSYVGFARSFRLGRAPFTDWKVVFASTTNPDGILTVMHLPHGVHPPADRAYGGKHHVLTQFNIKDRTVRYFATEIPEPIRPQVAQYIEVNEDGILRLTEDLHRQRLVDGQLKMLPADRAEMWRKAGAELKSANRYIPFNDIKISHPCTWELA